MLKVCASKGKLNELLEKNKKKEEKSK
jgi:hypothetical protein